MKERVLIKKKNVVFCEQGQRLFLALEITMVSKGPKLIKNPKQLTYVKAIFMSKLRSLSKEILAGYGFPAYILKGC